MAFDAHKNLAITTVTVGTGVAGTALTVAIGEGSRFPAVPFNATVWPSGVIPTPVNGEIVRVTARAADVLTITRAQEGTTARVIAAGDLIAATITAKSLTDIESGANFPELATSGPITFTANGLIRTNSVDGADDRFVQISPVSAGDPSRGPYFNLFGNEFPGAGGVVVLSAGNTPTGTINFFTGNGISRGQMHPSGGFSWGSTTDPGAGRGSFAGGASSLRGTLAGVPSGTATQMFTMAGMPGAGAMLVAANLVSGDMVNYGAFAVLLHDGVAARIALINNGTLFTITLAGLSVRITQSSGSPQPVVWSALRVD